MIKLRKMTEEEYEEFVPFSKAAYAEDKMRANGLSKDEASKIAQVDFERYLPDGYKTKDSYLNIISNEKEEYLGHLWFVVRGAVESKKAFIADIYMKEEHRAKGHGRAAMLLLEDEVKQYGASHIGLHVFGFNTGAIHLYKSLNYEVSDIVMEKKLN